jgi:cysteine desulfurase
MSNQIYLDSLATTPLAPQALAAMLPWLREAFGNASSTTHAFGWDASEAVEIAREQIADLVGARQPRELVFTSGATESNNTVIQGVWAVERHGPPHIVTTALEHPSVLASCQAAAQRGAKVTVVKPGHDGVVVPEAVERALRPSTRLVTIMIANNEIGTIQPIAEIAAIARERAILSHVDASQAVGKIPVDLDRLGVDSASISAHKLYGPKGVGALYLRAGSAAENLPPLLYGGGQEQDRRAGTLAVPLIVGFGEAARLAGARLVADQASIAALRDALWTRLSARVSGLCQNGSTIARLPGCLNFSVAGVSADALIASAPEIAMSAGSACSSGKGAGSHVLEAIGVPYDQQRSTIRVGVSRYTTIEEIRTAARVLERAICEQRGDPTRSLEIAA